MTDNTETLSGSATTTSKSQPLDTIALEDLIKRDYFTEENEVADTPAENTEEEEPSSEETQEEETDSNTSQTDDEEADEATEAEAEKVEEAVEEAPESSDKLTKGVQKRIDKLVRQKKEADERLRELESQLDSIKDRQNEAPEREMIPVGKDMNPYFHLQDESEVHDEIRNARKVRRWAEENSEGTVVRGKDGEETEYSAEQVRAIKLNAIDAIEEHLPAQLDYVANRKHFDVEAEKSFPYWKDRSSSEYQLANQMLREFPEIRKFPNYKTIIGDIMLGKATREAKVSSSSVKTLIKKAPATPKTTVAPVSVDSKLAKTKDAEIRFRKNNSSDAFKDLVAARFL